jgi:hypothetical protein
MKTTIEFEYSIGDKVTVSHAGDVHGGVAGMSQNINGIMYRVIWWQDGRRLDEWLFAWEIEPYK